jgi:hypothetical protein
MQNHRLWSGIVLGFGCFLLSSCGASSPNVAVSGHVTVKGGLPVDEGQLILMPDPADPKRATCGATIGTDGKFTCASTKGGAGIPPGKYKVVLSFSAGKGKVNPFVEAFKQYTQAETTPLKLDVPAGGLKDYHIELEEPPAPKGKESTTSEEMGKEQPADATK